MAERKLNWAACMEKAEGILNEADILTKWDETKSGAVELLYDAAALGRYAEYGCEDGWMNLDLMVWKAISHAHETGQSVSGAIEGWHEKLFGGEK